MFFSRRKTEQALLVETLKELAAERRAESARTEAFLAEMREQREKDQKAFLDTIKAISEQNTKVIEAVTGTVAAQANALSEHLSLFKTTSEPVGRTTRDEDEWRMERERLANAGYDLPEEELAGLLRLQDGLVQDLDLN